jgi:hypothetical protein
VRAVDASELKLAPWAREVSGTEAPESPLAGSSTAAQGALFLARERLVREIGDALGLYARGLLVKGAALALTTYSRPWERPMTDVDLLVEPGRFRDVVQLLERRGFRRTGPAVRAEELLEVELLPPAPLPSIPLEIHASLDKVVPRALPFDELWQRGAIVGEGLLRTPSPEDHLLVVAIHLANDELAHPWGFVDLEALVRGGADLAIAWSRATTYGATLALWAALSVVHHRVPGLLAGRFDLDAHAPTPWRRAILLRWFDPTAWPIARTPTQLGAPGVLKQLALRDDWASYARGVGVYLRRRSGAPAG